MTMDFTTTYDQGKETPLLSTMDGKNDNIGAADGMSPEHGSTDHNSSITFPAPDIEASYSSGSSETCLTNY